MQSLQRPKNKKRLLIFIGIAVLIVAAIIAYIVLAKPFSKAVVTTIPDRPANDVDYGPPTEAEKETADQRKEDIIQQNENPGPVEDANISVSIVRADQASAGQPLNIRVDIVGASSGTCEVTLTKGGQPTVAKSFQVVFEATSSRCQSADIPASEFSQGGEWHLSLVVKGSKGQSKPAEQTVDISK